MRFQFDTRAFIVVVALVLALGAACSAVFWGDLSATEDGKSESLSTTVRNVMLILAALLALPLAIWRGWVAERQVEATQSSVNAAQEAISNQRFQAAAQMLDNDVNAVRLGALHTLVALAREDPRQYYVQSARLLAGFVRKPTTGDNVQVVKEARGQGKPIREDVSVALDFIGSRSAHELQIELSQDFTINLEGVQFPAIDLQHLNLARTILSNANLANAHCDHTDFSDSDLSSALLSGTVLEGAVFCDARLSATDFSTKDRSRDIMRLPSSEYNDVPSPALGLTQEQLDQAQADPEHPPTLEGVADAVTGRPLVWRGRAIG